MELSWTEFIGDCKSSLSSVARGLFISRENFKDKYFQLQEQFREVGLERDAANARLAELERNNRALLERIGSLEGDLQKKKAADCAVSLPEDTPLARHEYGPRIMSLMVNLARKVGLRASVRVARLVFDWLGIKCRLPTWQAVRGWMQRVGLARTKRLGKAVGRTWIVDHSIQVGKEKVLLVLRTRSSKPLEPGRPLTQADVEPLAVLPAIKWDADAMATTYQSLAQQFGDPRAIVMDGAPELREGAKALQKPGSEPLVLHDPKHFLANQLESVVGRDPQFVEFVRKLTSTRAAVQQTELAHLAPPSLKPKARFMNLEPLLNWGAMVLWQLDHPESKARHALAPCRMGEKFGWLRDFAEDLPCWRACQAVVSIGVKFAAENGIFRGAADEFRRLSAPSASCEGSRQIAQRTIEFLREHESLLKSNERLPTSTEIAESSFGLYKQFERQHSKGGFTSLLLTFGALLSPSTPASIERDFDQVKVHDVKQWVQDHLPTTVASKRQAAYREYRKHNSKPLQIRATAKSASG